MDKETADVENTDDLSGNVENDDSSHCGTAAPDELGSSVSGTHSSSDRLFQRRLFLHFEILNPGQHKVSPRLSAEVQCRPCLPLYGPGPAP